MRKFALFSRITLIGGQIMFFIPQTQKDDCGFTCLKMMLANINKDQNYLFLPQDNDHGGYSYNDLVDIAKEYDLHLQAVRATEKETLGSCQQLPFIATVILPNEAKHAVLVTKVSQKEVTYLDPRKGKCKSKLHDFIAIWDGTMLIIESFQKKKCQYRINDPLNVTSKVFLFLIQFVAGLLAIFGVYFIKDGTPIYIPAIFLSLALVTELGMKAYAYRIMKKLDAHYFSEEVIPESGYRSYIEKYEQYKKLSLTSPMNYVLILVFSLGLLTIILLNDRRNGFLVLVPLMLALIEVLFIIPLYKRKKNEIEELEEEIDTVEDASSLKQKVKEAHNKAYTYSYFSLAMRYIYAGIIVMTALLTMKLCDISSFPYIIFYSCVSLTLYRSISELFMYGERIEEYKLSKIKLNNSVRKN